MAIKDRIKEARQNNHLTQEQLAAKLGIAKYSIPPKVIGDFRIYVR
mgnify:CR=1 FL=1